MIDGEAVNASNVSISKFPDLLDTDYNIQKESTVGSGYDEQQLEAMEGAYEAAPQHGDSDARHGSEQKKPTPPRSHCMFANLLPGWVETGQTTFENCVKGTTICGCQNCRNWLQQVGRPSA